MASASILINSSSYAITASLAANASNAYAISFVPEAANSASWASSSISSSYASVAGTSQAISFVPYAATFATQSQIATQSLTATSASWASASISASYAANAGNAYAINFVPSAAISASWVSASVKITTADTALFVDTASYASTIPQTISVVSLTASFISSSKSVIAASPTHYYDVATKGYVDDLTAQTNLYYFRTGSSGILGSTLYFVALGLGTPLSSSESSFTITAVSSSQYIAGFISPPIAVTTLPAGNITVHYHAYFNVGGICVTDLQTELYSWSASLESEIAVDSPITLGGGITDQYTSILTLTSSLILQPQDRLIIKFKAINTAGDPDITMTVDGNTSAGVSIPIPSSNFVLKGGDTMTGNLIVPRVIGTASFADAASYAFAAISASWAPGGPVGPSVSASWASASISASYAETANVALNATVPYAVENATQSLYATQSISSSYALSSSWVPDAGVPITAVSASWVSASVTIDTASYAATASIALSTPSSIFSRGGTFYNASNIPNTLTWITVWRAPFNCTASAFNTLANVGNIAGVSSASVNARRNGTLNMLTASGYPITGSGAYVALGSTFLQNNLFSTGDELEIGIIGTTGSISQVNIQVDFIR